MVNLEQTMAYGVGKSAATVAAAIKKDFGMTLPTNFFEDMGARISPHIPANLDRWTGS
jgi:hypothetical protein